MPAESVNIATTAAIRWHQINLCPGWKKKKHLTSVMIWLIYIVFISSACELCTVNTMLCACTSGGWFVCVSVSRCFSQSSTFWKLQWIRPL